jgi:hypothetical protein
VFIREVSPPACFQELKQRIANHTAKAVSLDDGGQDQSEAVMERW